MWNPFEVLGLPGDATSAEIRQRYLQLVRQYTPERYPERFAEINTAYEVLKDPVKRVSNQLFARTTDSFQAIADDAKSQLKKERIPIDTLLSLGED